MTVTVVEPPPKAGRFHAPIRGRPSQLHEFLDRQGLKRVGYYRMIPLITALTIRSVRFTTVHAIGSRNETKPKRTRRK